MGVPRLFKYINDNYGSNIIKITNQRFQRKIDNIFFDSNSLLHRAAQIVFNYGSAKKDDSTYFEMSTEEKIKAFYSLYFEYIKKYCIMFPAKKLIYIAIDGVAPLGKQSQQRQRRFKVGALSTTELEFDPNSLSPGTEIMNNLESFIKNKINEEKNKKSPFNGPKIVLSGPSEPGEGEQKCLKYIRDLKLEKKKDANIFYGPDGDLIMLGLATYCFNFDIIREDFFNSFYTTLIKIGKIGIEISQSMTDVIDQNTSPSIMKTDRYKNLINDFILLCFFVGNDFLPKVPMFYHLENGIDTIITTYRKFNNIENNTITKITSIPEDRVNVNMLLKFIKLISIKEDTMLYNQLFINYIKQDSKFIDNLLFKASKLDEKYDIIFDYDKYKKLYYTERVFIDIKDVTKMCIEYINGLIWVFNYYSTDHIKTSFRWYYPYYYAPLFNCIVETLSSNNKSSFIYTYTKEECIPSDPIQQLLTILPPTSKNLLPTKYHKLFDTDSPIHNIYPKQFSTDYQGKQKEYQGIALVPFVDWDRVNIAYKSI